MRIPDGPGQEAYLAWPPQAHAQVESRPFNTTWSVTAADRQIAIPVGAATGSYTIDWGDGSTPTTHTGAATHTYVYADPGNYIVSISGDFTRFDLSSSTRANAEKLLSIDQWGDIAWTSMRNAFQNAKFMVYNAADSPDLSRVTDMGSMFINAASFNGDITDWDTSSVTDMSLMFWGARSFNQPLDWNTSSVTDMNNMFNAATSFNQPLDWNTSSVTDMSGMFNRAISFNGNITNWNTSSVTDMNSMFFNAISFNGNITKWDTSSVTTIGVMFGGAISFNQPLDWNTSSVTSMFATFFNATSFNHPIGGWNTSSVIYMDSMFNEATSFNHPIGGWNTSSVTDMNSMFINATSFDQPIGDWNVRSVEDMTDMFDGADSFEQNLGGWYILLDSTDISRTDIPGTVGRMSTQNAFLTNQNPAYGVGPGTDSARFAADGVLLNMTSITTSKSGYTVNVTATGDDVFESGNNWRAFDVTVDGDVVPPAPELSSATTSPTNAASITVAVDFGESINAATFALADDLAIAGGATVANLANPSSDDRTFTFTLNTPAADGEVTVRIPAGRVADPAGNPNEPSNEFKMTFDGTAPVITLLGDPSVSVAADSTYSDPGATCTDAIAGDLTGSMATASNVDTAVPGQYSVAYVCTDLAGNSATQSRAVTVEGRQNPLDIIDPLDPPARCLEPADRPNSSPVVNVGPDFSITEGDTGTLSATITDPEGDAITEMFWTQLTPDTAFIDIADRYSLVTQFTAPYVDADTIIRVQMYACDGLHTGVGNDIVRITVVDRPPPVPPTGSLSGSWSVAELVSLLGHQGSHRHDLVSECSEDAEPTSASFTAHLPALYTQISYTAEGGSPTGTILLDVGRSYDGYLDAYNLVGVDHATSSSVIGGSRTAGITLTQYMDAASTDTFAYPDGSYTKSQIGGWTAYSADISWEGEGSCTLDLRRR